MRSPTSDGRLRAHHFGPHPAYVGGMGTVLALFAEQRIGAAEVTVHPTWVPDSHRRTAWLTMRALEAIQRLDPGEVVHVHVATRGSFVRKGVILAHAASRRLPVVVSLHGYDFAAFAQRQPALVRAVLHHAHVISALSDDAEAAARWLAPHAIVTQVPNPIRIPGGVPAVSGTDRIALFAGEIGTRKGADVLERAWPLVRDRLPDARCLVIGPATEFTPRSDESFVVLEPGPPKAVGELLRRARVAVLPSRAEGMPMFLLEAMAAGRPFVATPVGAIPRLAEHGGVLAPVGDHERLAAALTDLLADADRAQQLGRSGLELCLRTRSPELVGAVYAELYAQARARALRPVRAAAPLTPS